MKTDLIPPLPDGLKKDLVLVGCRTIFLTTNQLRDNVRVRVRDWVRDLYIIVIDL